MTKRLKILLKIIGVLLFIIVVVLFFSISKIDTTPYFETDYYQHTIEKMDDAIQNKTTSKGTLLAGFSRVNITPTIVKTDGDPTKGRFTDIKLAGYSSGHLASGAHDSIFAKAIAIEVEGQQIVLISADLALIPELVALRVVEKMKEKQIDLLRKQIHFGATHTHASIGNCIPGYVGETFGGDFHPEVVDWLGDKFVEVILAAIADKKPAQIASGYLSAPNLIKNRIIGETGRLNDKFSVISIVQDSARSAAIGVFAAHATTIGDWQDEFSGDYPGYFQRSLESKGVDMAMFFAGTVGSHTNRGEGSKFEKVKYIGNALADSAMVVLASLEYKNEVTLSTIVTEVEVPTLQIIPISNTLRLAPWLGQKLLTEMDAVLLQGFQLNDLIWTAMPYELSGEYAIDLKNALELEGYHSVFTSFNGQYLGYIIPAKYYYYETYEAKLMGWFGPSMGDYLMELNFKMANALTGRRL